MTNRWPIIGTILIFATMLAIAVAVFLIARAINPDHSPKTAAPLTEAAITVTDETGNPGCGIPIIPPAPEPCLAVQDTIRYTLLSNIQGSKQFQAWKRDNPGEYQRLTAYMQTGSPMAPTTFLGASLRDITQTYFYAYGLKPLAWPPPPTKAPTGAKDQTPPTSPSIP